MFTTPGVRALQGREICLSGFRGCRCAQPPANFSHPFRMLERGSASRGRQGCSRRSSPDCGSTRPCVEPSPICRQAQRDYACQPKVGASALPWVLAVIDGKPQRMCLAPEPREGKGRGIYPAGTTALQIRVGEFQGPLRYPTFLRTEVRAPFTRSATTLDSRSSREPAGTLD